MRRDQYDRQAEFTQRYLNMRFGRPHIRSEQDTTELTKEYVLALHREADEILDEVPWKGHRRYDNDEVIRSNIAEEIVDILKFATGLAYIVGLDYDQLCEEIDVKSDVVEDRWRQEHEETAFRSGVSPIALLDLDGVLNEYPGPFEQWVLDNNIVESHEKAKHLYRSSGIKRTLPAKDDSVVATQMLYAAGYSIVIMSQRPVDEYHRIYGDTLYWLRAHEVPYDRLIFVPKKQHRLMLDPYLPRIKFAVDDDPEVVVSLCNLGIKTYWINDVPMASDPGALAWSVKSMLDIPEVRASTADFQKEVLDGTDTRNR